MCDSSNNVPIAPVSTGSTPTKCTLCHKYYKNMAAHLKDHKRERKFECDYCHRKVNSHENNLKMNWSYPRRKKKISCCFSSFGNTN